MDTKSTPIFKQHTDRISAFKSRHVKTSAYALAHPSDAALIRSLGRLPRKFNGAPLTSEQAQDIVNSPSPILQTLAKRPQHRLASTAS